MQRRSRAVRISTIACAATLATAHAASAQTESKRNGANAATGADATVLAESVTVAASKRYKANGFYQWLVGSPNRKLWATPIRVPVLRLEEYAGGLTITKTGGGNQTKSLRLETANGTEYAFRLSDKTVTVMPSLIKGTPLAGILQDQVSSSNPASAVMSDPIVEASGILHPRPKFMVLPDDPILGEHRETFAGKLGMLEEYPNINKDGIGFGGASAIIDSDSLLQRLNSTPNDRVDARKFLTARLADILINDNDRHAGNWKWARVGSAADTVWEPIARDRDHAFIWFDGVIMRMSRLFTPRLLKFGKSPSLPALATPDILDARLLSELPKPVWDSVAQAFQRRITDSVIRTAVYAMPVEYQSVAPKLEPLLKARRDGMKQVADEYYQQLSKRVLVHGTDGVDQLQATRMPNGDLEIQIGASGKIHYHRLFRAPETSEVLVYLHDGDDEAVVRGTVPAGMLLRVIGGNGANRLVDSSSVGGRSDKTHLYDNSGTVTGVSYGKDTMFSRRPWEPDHGELLPPKVDAGSVVLPVVGISSHRGLGLTPSIGVARYAYGLRQRPYSSMVQLDGEYALNYRGGSIALRADQRLESSPWHFTQLARMSTLDITNYNGLGNLTADSGSSSPLTAVHQRRASFIPAIAYAPTSRIDVSIGPVIQHTRTDSATSPYVTATNAYGNGSFAQAGMQFDAAYEWRTKPTKDQHTHHRMIAELNGQYFPAVLDNRSAFSVVTITTGTSLSIPIPLDPLLIVRAGGSKLFGSFPFFEAAMLGGNGTLRYMDRQRYAGDAALYATTELRLQLARFKFLMPLRMGVLGLAEGGRVYVNGDSPGGWHAVTGGGIWFGRGNASPVVTLTGTTEAGRSGPALRFGLNF